MNLGAVELIGYAIGLLSVVVSVVLHVRSQRKNKERLARLLDPHVVHRDLLVCRARILRGKPPFFLRLFNSYEPALYGLHDLRILQQIIKNVQKHILIVRSENYNEYERLIEEALLFLKDGKTAEGINQLDEAIALLAAEAKVLGE